MDCGGSICFREHRLWIEIDARTPSVSAFSAQQLQIVALLKFEQKISPFFNGLEDAYA